MRATWIHQQAGAKHELIVDGKGCSLFREVKPQRPHDGGAAGVGMPEQGIDVGQQDIALPDGIPDAPRGLLQGQSSLDLACQHQPAEMLSQEQAPGHTPQGYLHSLFCAKVERFCSVKGNEGSGGGGRHDMGSQAEHHARSIRWGIRLQTARAHDAWRPDGHGRERMGRRWPAGSTASAALHLHSRRSHPHPRLPPQSHAQCHNVKLYRKPKLSRYAASSNSQSTPV